MASPEMESERVDPPVVEDIHVVYVAVGSQNEALTIAREVVSERLAACANIVPGVTSIYEWNGEVRQDDEWLIIMKAPQSRVSFLTDRIVQLHSYECPCVVSWPLADSHEPFCKWVFDQTRS